MNDNTVIEETRNGGADQEGGDEPIEVFVIIDDTWDGKLFVGVGRNIEEAKTMIRAYPKDLVIDHLEIKKVNFGEMVGSHG